MHVAIIIGVLRLEHLAACVFSPLFYVSSAIGFAFLPRYPPRSATVWRLGSLRELIRRVPSLLLVSFLLPPLLCKSCLGEMVGTDGGVEIIVGKGGRLA